jgi:hypothetical protein
MNQGETWFTGTLIVLLLLFVLITYISWITPIGIKIRYYYYTHAIVALSIVLAVVTLVITQSERRRAEQKAALQRTLRINQRYWVDLERFFAEHAQGLNRLYKQMWPHDADVQALPDLPSTPDSNMQEVHVANMLFGVISNMNAEIASNTPTHQVVAKWQQPEYRSWFGTLKIGFRQTFSANVGKVHIISTPRKCKH